MRRSPLKRRTPLRRRGESRDDAMWRNVRDRRLELDGYECQAPARGLAGECFGRLEVHHVLPRGRGGKDTLRNTITVCLACHARIHAHPEAAYAVGLLARSAT